MQSAPTVFTNASPETSFASFRSFDFVQSLGTDRANGVRTPLSSMSIDSMSRELASRGLQRSARPELLVNFFVDTEDRMEVRTVPTANSFHRYRWGRYTGWNSYQTTVREYTRGTLSIDLVDAASNVLVWEGVAQVRLRGNARDITPERIAETVGRIMAEFPPGANQP